MSDDSSLLRNPVFWVYIATIAAGLIKYIIAYVLKSKCSDFNLCWGMMKIKRDIAIERDIEIAQINHNVNPDLDIEINDGPNIKRPSITRNN